MLLLLLLVITVSLPQAVVRGVSVSTLDPLARNGSLQAITANAARRSDTSKDRSDDSWTHHILR
jgi:hypothetical protein